MKLKCFYAVAIALVVISRPALSQTMLAADLVQSQALIGRDEKGFSSCGFRSVVLTVGSNAQLYDFSLSLYRDTVGAMMKAGSYTGGRAARDLKDLKMRPTPKMFWIVSSNDGIAARPSRSFDSENKGFLLGAAELGPALRVIETALSGGALQFAVRYSDESVEKVVHYSPSLAEIDKTALVSCLGGLGDSWKQSFNGNP